MKRIYSFILLFSFLTGVSQPVMPMFDYLLYKGELSQILSSSDELSFCDWASERGANCEVDCRNDMDENVLLLDGDFYPVPLSIQPKVFGAILPGSPHIYTPVSDRLLTCYPPPHSPPPRHA